MFMKAGFLTKYSLAAASSRYRFHQFQPALERLGWDIEIESFYPSVYLKRLYGENRRSVTAIGMGLARRLKLLAKMFQRNYDVVFIQHEMLPHLPFAIERQFYSLKIPFVVDFDDAVHVRYENLPFLKTKIPRVISQAAHVIVGNEHLREYATRYNDAVSVIPTVIDLRRYETKASYSADGRDLIIGWIGNPVNTPHLRTLAGVLRNLSRKLPIRLRCIGTPADFDIDGVCVESLEWATHSETDILRTFDVGIMPLVDTPFTRGKCGFKLIQYMGCAVPSVGSAVGANRDIIADGENGYLAHSEDEWYVKLLALLQDEELRARIGRAGRRTVEERFSIDHAAPKLAAVLRGAASK